MTIHAKKRGHQRYNLQLSDGDLDNIVNQIITGQAIPLGNARGSKKKKLYYAKINKVPVKVLCNWDDFKIISMFPFDVDEYNEAKQKRLSQKEREAIALLNKLGYNIFDKYKSVESITERKKNMIVNNVKTIQCPKCDVQYEAEPLKQYVECQDCGCNYYQFSRTTDTPKWIGDFIERCKGG